jgi:hypothetical protein
VETPHELFLGAIFWWHIVKRGLDWTGKTRTGLSSVKHGLDSISKMRTGLC